MGSCLSARSRPWALIRATPVSVDTNPASEAYQRLMKESAYLTPLAEGYHRLQQLRKEVGQVMSCY